MQREWVHMRKRVRVCWGMGEKEDCARNRDNNTENICDDPAYHDIDMIVHKINTFTQREWAKAHRGRKGQGVLGQHKQ